MSDPKTVYSNDWFSIEEQKYDHLPEYEGKPFYRFKTGDGVVILAQTTKGKVILVRQYRPAFDEYSIEFPSGFIDAGESPLVAGARELLEETGYRCESMEVVGTTRSMTNRISSLEESVFGRNAVKVPEAKGEESVEVILASPTELKEMVNTGQFQQSSSLAMITMLNVKFGIDIFAE